MSKTLKHRSFREHEVPATQRPRKRFIAGLITVALAAVFTVAGSASSASAIYDSPTPPWWGCPGTPHSSSVDYGWPISYSGWTLGDSLGSCSHAGQDWDHADPHKFVYSTAAGTVKWNNHHDACYGYYLVIENQVDQNDQIYAHLSTRYVSVGNAIGKGAHIADTGSSGDCTTADHLHYSMASEFYGWTSTTMVFDPYAFILTH
jgi:murein DD-endopeptidase MepM/ murein hydrolase activator NlpD